MKSYLLKTTNRKPDISWDEKNWQKQESSAGMEIGVWGM